MLINLYSTGVSVNAGDFPGRLVFCTHSWEGFEDESKRDAMVYRHGLPRTDLHWALPEVDPEEEYGEDYDPDNEEAFTLYSEFTPEMLSSGKHGEVDLGVLCQVGSKKVYYWIEISRVTSHSHKEAEVLLWVNITKREKPPRKRPRVADFTVEMGMQEIKLTG